MNPLEEIHAPDSFDGSEGLIAIIIRRSFTEPGSRFFTAPEHPQQLAFMRHPQGKIIEPHTHRNLPRQVERTQEVLLIRNGSLRIDFYLASGEPLCTRVLGAGDVVMLVGGGHGMEMLDETELFEVKVGPYLGREQDKVGLPLGKRT